MLSVSFFFSSFHNGSLVPSLILGGNKKSPSLRLSTFVLVLICVIENVPDFLNVNSKYNKAEDGRQHGRTTGGRNDGDE